MRRLALVVASAAVVVFCSVAPGLAASSSQQPAGQQSQDAADAREEFNLARLAPNGAVDPNAFEAVVTDAMAIATVGGAWTERTNLPGADGNDFSDSPQYIDPTSGFSNSGAGDRWVAGRVTSLAAAPDGAVFLGAADGGVRSTAPTPDSGAALVLSVKLTGSPPVTAPLTSAVNVGFASP